MMGDNQRWDVGDPIGLGNDIGAPEVPYMSYAPRPVESEEEIEERLKEEEEQRKIEELKYRSKRISDEAWALYMEGRNDEALIFIDRSLEICKTANSINRKAIILEALERFPDALHYYDWAMERGSSEVFKHNKAVCLIRHANFLKGIGFDGDGLSQIEKALEIFQNISDKSCEDEAWNLKGIFLEGSGDIAGAFNCYKRALEMAEDDSNMKQTYLENRDRLLQYIADVDINCPNCGEMLRITDNYCFKCRTPIDESVKIVLKNMEGCSEERKMTVEHNSSFDADIIHFDDE